MLLRKVCIEKILGLQNAVKALYEIIFPTVRETATKLRLTSAPAMLGMMVAMFAYIGWDQSICGVWLYQAHRLETLWFPVKCTTIF